MATTFQHTNLQGRARRYAIVINLLYGRVGLAGSLKAAHRGARHLSLGVRLSDPTQLDRALKLAEPLALHAGTENVLAQRDGGLVFYQFQLAQGFWEQYTRADVSGLAVGLAESRRPVLFDLDPPHALVAGTTGSGKSETLKSILLALLTTYTPQELGVILVDPHRDYSDFANVAHLVMPIANEPGDIRQALAWANNELAHRKAEDIKEGRAIVIAVDEADLALADKMNLEAAKNIAKQARKYRVHLIVSTHKPLHSDLPGILDMLINRFIGLVSDAKISATLTGHAGLQAHKLTGKGDFLHIAGAICERFQVAMATRQDYEALPRTEVKPVEVNALDLLTLPPEKPIGRPTLEVDPVIAAQYFWRNPNSISIAMARELFNLSRNGHDLHKKFVLDFITELRRLRAAAQLGG
ncbi:MAG: hypothetical protein DPW09_17805 [Anaerolineae bacterium]|nr:DUF87 domain-containing protein [Anaerolineales bacterium]MCQ3975301.1 hypothetical protein [Anaerolineae bacterium]